MFIKSFFLTIFIIGASSRYLSRDDFPTPRYYIDDNGYILADDLEDILIEQPHESVYPGYLSGLRVRRDTHGSVTVNSDGTSGAAIKIPFAGNEKNVLSAIGSADLDKNFKLGAATAGFALDNVNGHGLTLTKTQIPDFGDKFTAAGKVNVFHNDNHDFTAKAFATKNIPNHPMMPNFNTVGGGVDYMYKDKVGASVGAAHTDFFNRNDYSAMGKLNLFKDHDTSIDFTAGVKKFDTPFMSSSWTPNYGFSLSKFW